jgi:hypothetical protein
MSQDESIAQSATSTIEQIEEDLGTDQETLESSSQEQSLETDEQYQIPEKFVGKSPFEIAQAYREAEKDRGRLANELGSARKEREELENRLKELERESARYAPMPTQVAPPTQPTPQVEADPLSVIDTQWDEDPKQAFKNAIRLQQEMLTKQNQQQSVQQRQTDANQWYYSQKKENPDYARREQLMQQASHRFNSIIKPEYANSVEVLQALDLISRGMDIDYYSKQAVDKARQDGLSVREEKRRAQSESSYSEGESSASVDVRKMPLDDLEKLLGESDDD